MTFQPYLLVLTNSEKMALVDILGEHLRNPNGTQQFIDVTAGPEHPPVTTDFLLHTLLHAKPGPTIVDEARPDESVELSLLRAWQRTALRAFFNMGQLAALMHEERKQLRAALLVAKGDAHSPGVLEAIEKALDDGSGAPKPPEA